MEFIKAHAGTIIAGLLIVYGAIYRALPASSSDFKWGQFIIDFIKGLGQQLPDHAPKLTAAQKAMAMSVPPKQIADPPKP
jgi:hypothetical protein